MGPVYSANQKGVNSRIIWQNLGLIWTLVSIVTVTVTENVIQRLLINSIIILFNIGYQLLIVFNLSLWFDQCQCQI